MMAGKMIWISLSVMIYCMAMIQSSLSAKIAVAGSFYVSHTRVLAEIGEELHRRGHQVTVITSLANQFVGGKAYKVWYYQTPVTQHDIGSCTAVALKNNDVFISTCMKHLIDDNEAYLNDDDLLRRIKAEKFGKLK